MQGIFWKNFSEVLERDYEIGDVVYSKKMGIGHQYEVTYVYPLEAGEKHFRLRCINGFDPFDMNHQSERMYATEYFYHMPWIVERKLIFEKWTPYKKNQNKSL